MWRLAVHEIKGQWRLTALVSFGLILAAVAYLALVGTASGSTTVLTGDIGKAWNTPYDLLVRPPGDVSRLERSEGLVSPNFISSISGGISEAQLGAIRRIPGVSVAAPIAVVGYTEVAYTIDIPNPSQLIGPTSFAVIRVEQSATAEDGLAHYPAAPIYVIWAPKGVLTVGAYTANGLTARLTYAGKTIYCNGATVQCAAGTIVCSTCVSSTASLTSSPAAQIMVEIPMMIAGIDPNAEAKLEGLKSTLVKGHYLPTSEQPIVNGPNGYVIPVILSTQSFISETVRVQASAASDPTAILSGTSLNSLVGWSQVYQNSRSIQSLYAQLIAQQSSDYDLGGSVLAIPGQIHYRELSPSHLSAETVPTDTHALLAQNCLGCAQVGIPPDASDTWFRQLTVSTLSPSKSSSRFEVVGEYDPGKILGFNALAGGSLSAYAPPEALLPNGKQLLPNRNPAGFITSPPLILTTLAGAEYFADNYTNGASTDYISAIQIKVGDTSKPSNAAQVKLTAVAEAIHQRTGLDVSLVKGSSAVPIRVSLPAGKFGEPPLSVTEYWGKEGTAIALLRGVNTESLVLFIVTAGVVLVLLGVIGQLDARRRRRDFALLRAIGWPLAHVVRLATIEMALLGIAVGSVTALLAIGVTRVVDPSIQLLPLLGVVPIVVAMSVLAPLPALLGSAKSPASAALQRGGRLGHLRVRSVRTLALRDLLGPWRVESLLCIASTTIGSGLVGGVVLVEEGFAGALGPTTLGRYLANQVGPLDVVMIVIAIVAGAGSSAALLSLAYLERQAEFSTLRAIGWPRAAVALVVAVQALSLGVAGGIVAAALVMAGGLAIGAPAFTILTALLLAVLVAVLTATVAMTGTLSLAYRLPPAAALRAE